MSNLIIKEDQKFKIYEAIIALLELVINSEYMTASELSDIVYKIENCMDEKVRQ